MTESNHKQDEYRSVATHREALPLYVRILFRGVLPLIVLAAGAYGAVRLVQTSPKAKQRPAQAASRLVQTRSIELSSQPAVVEAMGSVIAAAEVVVQPQVSGVVVKVSPDLKPGGRVALGDVLLEIDDSDYKAMVAQAEASLRRSEAQLQSAIWDLEWLRGLEGPQAVSQRELDKGITATSVAEADVAAAKAALARARLDLERTVIRAPFNAIVTTESVDLGAHVTVQSQLARLVGTDEYWVQVSVPIDRLPLIALPDSSDAVGSSVLVRQHLGSGHSAEWNGHVVRLMGDLDPQGRMARLLVSVPDPLVKTPGDSTYAPLLIGAYVDAEISGRTFADVVVLSREELRDGNTVWIMGDDSRLEIRPVEVAHRGRTEVLINDGLAIGDRIIISDLPAPVSGMALRSSESAVGSEVGSSSLASSRDQEGDE